MKSVTIHTCTVTITPVSAAEIDEADKTRRIDAYHQGADPDRIHRELTSALITHRTEFLRDLIWSNRSMCGRWIVLDADKDPMNLRLIAVPFVDNRRTNADPTKLCTFRALGNRLVGTDLWPAFGYDARMGLNRAPESARVMFAEIAHDLLLRHVTECAGEKETVTWQSLIDRCLEDERRSAAVHTGVIKVMPTEQIYSVLPNELRDEFRTPAGITLDEQGEVVPKIKAVPVPELVMPEPEPDRVKNRLIETDREAQELIDEMGLDRPEVFGDASFFTRESLEDFKDRVEYFETVLDLAGAYLRVDLDPIVDSLRKKTEFLQLIRDAVDPAKKVA